LIEAFCGLSPFFFGDQSSIFFAILSFPMGEHPPPPLVLPIPTVFYSFFIVPAQSPWKRSRKGGFLSSRRLWVEDGCLFQPIDPPGETGYSRKDALIPLPTLIDPLLDA